MSINRRSVLGLMAGATGAAALPSWTFAQDNRLNVLAVPVHAEMMQGGEGGGVAGAWSAATGASIEWLNFANAALAERLFRELSLRTTEIDLAFFSDPWASSNILGLLEPLDDYQARAPIEDFDDIFPGPLRVLKLGDSLRGIPIRQGIAGLHYNTDYFAERGLGAPPATVEELIEMAKQLTYTRSDGTVVAGLVFPSKQSNYTHFVRAWDADFVDEQLNVRAAEPEMIEAITALKGLYDAGALPRQFPVLSDDDSISWIQGGRAAMTVTTMTRYVPHNDPATSLFPGKIAVGTMPISASLADKYPVAPVGLTFWSLVMPANSTRKELAWDLIRTASSVENAMVLAENGNSPMRQSTFDNPGYAEIVPYAAAEMQASQVARVGLPAFEKAAQAIDLIKEECEAGIIGLKTPEQAMTDLAEGLKGLLPA